MKIVDTFFSSNSRPCGVSNGKGTPLAGAVTGKSAGERPVWARGYKGRGIGEHNERMLVWGRSNEHEARLLRKSVRGRVTDWMARIGWEYWNTDRVLNWDIRMGWGFGRYGAGH